MSGKNTATCLTCDGLNILNKRFEIFVLKKWLTKTTVSTVWKRLDKTTFRFQNDVLFPVEDIIKPPKHVLNLFTTTILYFLWLRSETELRDNNSAAAHSLKVSPSPNQSIQTRIETVLEEEKPNGRRTRTDGRWSGKLEARNKIATSFMFTKLYVYVMVRLRLLPRGVYT